MVLCGFQVRTGKARLLIRRHGHRVFQAFQCRDVIPDAGQQSGSNHLAAGYQKFGICQRILIDFQPVGLTGQQ